MKHHTLTKSHKKKTIKDIFSSKDTHRLLTARWRHCVTDQEPSGAPPGGSGRCLARPRPQQQRCPSLPPRVPGIHPGLQQAAGQNPPGITTEGEPPRRAGAATGTSVGPAINVLSPRESVLPSHTPERPACHWIFEK